MDLEKLKQAKQLIEDCISECETEESDEGDTSSEDTSSEDSTSGDMGNDKVKMAIQLMKRKG